MIERTTDRFGRLIFGRNAIVRAALRAYVEGYVARLPNCLSFPAADGAIWTGDVQQGALYNDNGEGDYEVIAWTEVGVVGLACQLGFGPIEQLELSLDAVTGGPDDVRAAVPGLPDELESAFVMAAGMLEVGLEHGERQAGVGFWLHGDRVGGTLFDTPTALGVWRLACWGRVGRGRLLPPYDAKYATTTMEETFRKVAPLLALVDAITARALVGPTELLPEEIATVLPEPPLKPYYLPDAQRRLQEVGITWPGLGEL